jgi:integrase
MAERLTDALVRRLAAPAQGNKLHYDDVVKGFACRVTKAGAKSFVLNFYADGRERRLTIGSYPDWNVTAARERAKELKRLVDLGEDPMATRDQARGAPTVRDLAERYKAEHGPRKRPRSLAEDVTLLEQHIVPRLGRMRVDAVRRVDVETLHRAISKETPTRANRVLALLSTMFALALRWELCAINPCRGVEKNREHRRERYLTADELGRLMAALAEHPHQRSADAIRLLLLTGSRRNEVLGAQWAEFDLSQGIWTKPHTSTKQGKSHRVPLSAPARQLLAEMRAKSGPALFPGRRGGDQQQTLKTFWRAICRNADLRDLRVHDLRHAFASYLASSGLSLPVIGALLGHSSPTTTQRYAHLLDDPLRAATEKVGAIVTGASKEAAEVLPLRGRRA